MRRPKWLAGILCLMAVVPVAAQEPAVVPPATSSATSEHATILDAQLFGVGTTEWIVQGGPARGVVVLHSAGGHRYFLQTVSWGRILTAPRGSGALRGRFTWAVEAAPIFGQYTPTDTYGVGLSPIVWRWNFEPRGRFAPYAELAGGGLWTRDPVPARTTTSNFTAHAGYGLRIFVRPHQALLLNYRFHHISNGNRRERNPGVNAHVFMFGFSYLRPRK